MSDTYQALRGFGDIFVCLGDDQSTLNAFYCALDGFTRIGIHGGQEDCLLSIGEILMRQGGEVEAKKSWVEARSLFSRASQRKNVAWIDERLSIHLGENSQISLSR